LERGEAAEAERVLHTAALAVLGKESEAKEWRAKIKDFDEHAEQV